MLISFLAPTFFVYIKQLSYISAPYLCRDFLNQQKFSIWNPHYIDCSQYVDTCLELRLGVQKFDSHLPFASTRFLQFVQIALKIHNLSALFTVITDSFKINRELKLKLRVNSICNLQALVLSILENIFLNAAMNLTLTSYSDNQIRGRTSRWTQSAALKKSNKKWS